MKQHVPMEDALQQVQERVAQGERLTDACKAVAAETGYSQARLIPTGNSRTGKRISNYNPLQQTGGLFMFANYHTHTARCHHATGEDKAYVEAAIQNGFQVLGFSDHCPWIFSDGYVSPIRMTPDELDGYVTSLTALKKEYAADITIYIGLESEYVPEMLPEAAKVFTGLSD